LIFKLIYRRSKISGEGKKSLAINRCYQSSTRILELLLWFHCHRFLL
jgi:hypothetical protein